MVKIDNGMDGNLYRQIIEGDLMDTLAFYGLEKDEIIFQHDNDSTPNIRPKRPKKTKN